MRPMRWFARAAAWAIAAVALHAAALAAAPLPTAPPSQVGMSAERLDKLAPLLEEGVAGDSFPGAVVMVARRGKLVYSEAVGRLKPDGPPMPTDAIFRIYSMTKPLVSVAAMLLVEDGRLQLTDPVGKYLPGFDDMEVSVDTTEGSPGEGPYRMAETRRPMTVQDLLRHTSGLAYGEITANAPVKEGYREAGVYGTGVPFEARGMAPDEQIARMAGVPLAYQPGTAWNYSLSTDILGRVVEKASGQRLADFMEQRMFAPLDMADTGFWVPEGDHDRIAEALPEDPVTGDPNILIDVTEKPANDSGGAGGVSTAGDFLRFCQMLLNGGALEGARVMSPTTVRLMASDHLGDFIRRPMSPGGLIMDTRGYTFGLGFAVRTADGIAAVPGTAGGYTWAGYAGTYFWMDPAERLTAVFMIQAPTSERAAYRRLIRQLVYQAIVE